MAQIKKLIKLYNDNSNIIVKIKINTNVENLSNIIKNFLKCLREEKSKKNKNICKEIKKKTKCKKCLWIGHGICSSKCILNIKINEELKRKIKNHFMNDYDDFNDDREEHFEILSEKLNTSSNKVKTIYTSISVDDLIDKNLNLENFKKFNKNIEKIKCYECKKELPIFKINSNRIWKENTLCDKCWCKHENERDDLWEKVIKYKPQNCHMCSVKKEYKIDVFTHK